MQPENIPFCHGKSYSCYFGLKFSGVIPATFQKFIVPTRKCSSKYFDVKWHLLMQRKSGKCNILFLAHLVKYFSFYANFRLFIFEENHFN